MTMELPTNLNDDLTALYDNLMALPFTMVSHKQVLTLVGLISQGLKNKSREMRIGVLRMMAGQAMKELYDVEIKSTKNLSGPIASYLIDKLHDPGYRPHEWRLSNWGRNLISRCEDAIEASITERTG